MNCRDCRWFTKKLELQYGRCHRDPPMAGWPAVQASDFCSRFEPHATAPGEIPGDSLRQMTVMAKQLSNGYPVLPLPENIAAFRGLLNAKASTDTTADHSEG